MNPIAAKKCHWVFLKSPGSSGKNNTIVIHHRKRIPCIVVQEPMTVFRAFATVISKPTIPSFSICHIFKKVGWFTQQKIVVHACRFLGEHIAWSPWQANAITTWESFCCCRQFLPDEKQRFPTDGQGSGSILRSSSRDKQLWTLLLGVIKRRKTTGLEWVAEEHRRSHRILVIGHNVMGSKTIRLSFNKIQRAWYSLSNYHVNLDDGWSQEELCTTLGFCYIIIVLQAFPSSCAFHLRMFCTLCTRAVVASLKRDPTFSMIAILSQEWKGPWTSVLTRWLRGGSLRGPKKFCFPLNTSEQENKQEF
jgi:hypothetical protein